MSGLATAAAGGFTDVLLAPNTQPAVSTKSIIQFVLQRAAGNIVNLHPIGTATQQTEGKDLAEMMDMRAHGAIAFSDGWKPVQQTNLMMKALEYVRAFNGIIMQQPVDAALAADGMAGIPTLAETLMVHRDIALLRYTGSRLHLTGISTAESVAMIRKAKAEGLSITCSVTPYHLALTDDMLTGYDSMYKVSPPLRAETDRIALIEGLCDGTIDCIASHHRPHEWDAKTKEFAYAADGVAVQELTFNILWDTLKAYLTIDRLVETMTMMPRDIFGLPPAEIKAGNKACLTIFTTASMHTLLAPQASSASMNNPFLGNELAGKVLGIINNGQTHLNK
jgi:dihydroorotase